MPEKDLAGDHLAKTITDHFKDLATDHDLFVIVHKHEVKEHVVDVVPNEEVFVDLKNYEVSTLAVQVLIVSLPFIYKEVENEI